MLTRAEEKQIRALHSKKGRQESGRCLVEGGKVIATAGDAVQYTFTPDDTDQFEKLVTTETPQTIAGVAAIPEWTKEDLLSRETVIVLDGVQDPGNVGSILRLCLGFNASLILIESADPTSPKVVRSSVGAMFRVPWMKISRDDASVFIAGLKRPIYRLEQSDQAVPPNEISLPAILIAGNEGSGISIPISGTPVAIAHNDALESLNVGHALAITLAKLP